MKSCSISLPLGVTRLHGCMGYTGILDPRARMLGEVLGDFAEIEFSIGRLAPDACRVCIRQYLGDGLNGRIERKDRLEGLCGDILTLRAGEQMRIDGITKEGINLTFEDRERR